MSRKIPTRVHVPRIGGGRTLFRAHEDDLWSVRNDSERAASARGKPMFYPARLNKICPPPPKYSRDTARPYVTYRFFFPQQRCGPARAHAHRRATARGCRHTKWHERMKRIKGKNDQGRRDGLRAASSISPGLSRRARFPLSDTPRTPCIYPSVPLVVGYTYLVRSTCAAAQQRVHAHVCSCCAQFVNWNLNNTRPTRRRIGDCI